MQPKYGVLDHFISQMTGITNDRWTDYQKTFDNRYDFDRSVGLADALELCEIEPDGHFHDGLDDAINTADIVLARARKSGIKVSAQPAKWESTLTKEQVREKIFFERLFEGAGETKGFVPGN